jgi:signal transduction histidine kinase
VPTVTLVVVSDHNAEPTTDAEAALLRAVIGYRIVAAVWLAILGVLILAERGTPADRPWRVALTITAVAAWTTVASVISLRDPNRTTTGWFVALDVGGAIGSIVAADWAGTFVFAGGYPLAAVFATLLSRGTVPGMIAAGSLSITAIIRLGTITGATASDTSFVIVYLFAGGAAAWAFSVIRTADRRRAEAEGRLRTEQAERARAEEHAAFASRIHDSVLQTLALIQRDGDDPRRVRQLARRQERELRMTLFGSGAATDEGLREALGAACAEVEEMTGVRASLVMVGDHGGGVEVEALALATREALLNAAKHAGVEEVAVYGEADDGAATVFVRDRGVGFSPAAVGPGRRGIADSIVARMAAVGGSADVTSKPGGGTEVRLAVPWPPT